METGEKKSLIRRLKDVPPVRLIVSSFFIIIVIGAVLLALPISARDRQATDLLSSFLHRLPLPASPDWWYSTPGPIGPPLGRWSF